jgi:hypothetical protein
MISQRRIRALNAVLELDLFFVEFGYNPDGIGLDFRSRFQATFSMLAFLALLLYQSENASERLSPLILFPCTALRILCSLRWANHEIRNFVILKLFLLLPSVVHNQI